MTTNEFAMQQQYPHVLDEAKQTELLVEQQTQNNIQ